MRKAEKMIIYNLFPLLGGKFEDWDQHLLRASRMGFNWIFVNPPPVSPQAEDSMTFFPK